jgi:hypothetical protein
VFAEGIMGSRIRELTGVHAVAQVLHAGLAAVLLAILWLRSFGLWAGRQEA